MDDAIRRFQEASVLNPDYVAVALNLGNIYLETNVSAKAEASFKKALAREPGNAAALYGLGQLALSQRNYAEAVNFFEKALQQAPGANRIHYSLALAYRGAGDLAEAEAHLAKRGPVGIRVADPLFDQLPDLIEGERSIWSAAAPRWRLSDLPMRRVSFAKPSRPSLTAGRRI